MHAGFTERSMPLSMVQELTLLLSASTCFKSFGFFLLESTQNDWIATTVKMYKEQIHILLTSFCLKSAALIHQWPLLFSL